MSSKVVEQAIKELKVDYKIVSLKMIQSKILEIQRRNVDPRNDERVKCTKQL